MQEELIALKAELQESAQLGFAECRAADELKRKNADLERELLEFKFSPSSTGSTEWKWPTDRPPDRHPRNSTTSSDAGIANARKQVPAALAAQFDADVGDFIRENEELKDKVLSVEKAKKELEAKLHTELQEIVTLKSKVPASQVKAGMQVQHIARGINKDKRKEELIREVDAEKMEVANLESALKQKTQEAFAELKTMGRELEEEKATREVDIRKAQQARDKEIRWLHQELEATKYRISSLPSPGPESPFRGRLSVVEDSLAAQLGDFADRQEHEDVVLANSGASTALEALEETKANLKTEMEEVRHLREKLQEIQGVETSKAASGAASGAAAAEASLRGCEKCVELKSLREECQAKEELAEAAAQDPQRRRLTAQLLELKVWKEEKEAMQRKEEVQRQQEKNDIRRREDAVRERLEEINRKEQEKIQKRKDVAIQSAESARMAASTRKDVAIQSAKPARMAETSRKDVAIQSQETAKVAENMRKDVTVQSQASANVGEMPKTPSVQSTMPKKLSKMQGDGEVDVFEAETGRREDLSPSSKDQELLRSLAALRYVEAHWYP